MNDSIKKAFRRYQLMAWIVGTVLALLALIALPLKYIADVVIPGYSVLWQLHGFLFMVYLLATADLGVKAKWGVVQLMTTALWGTIPLMSFVAERKLRATYA